MSSSLCSLHLWPLCALVQPQDIIISSNWDYTAQKSHGRVLLSSLVSWLCATHCNMTQPSSRGRDHSIWPDGIHITHSTRIGSNFGFTQLRKFCDWLFDTDLVAGTYGQHTISMHSTSLITHALYVYTLASSLSTPALARSVFRICGCAIWSLALAERRPTHSFLNICPTFPNIVLTNIVLTPSRNIVHTIAECLVQKRLSNTIRNWFVCQVGSNNSEGKAESSQDLESFPETAKHWGESAVLTSEWHQWLVSRINLYDECGYCLQGHCTRRQYIGGR